MTTRPTPQPGILKIAPYVPGKSGAADGRKTIKLSANESALGASPAALAALVEAVKAPEIYPEGSARVLREAIGEVHGIDPDRIICGNGSDELLHLLAQCYLGDGDEAILSQYGFAVYPIVTLGAGATPVRAAAKDYGANVDALLAAVTERTKLVFLDNPNNPTGTYLPADELARLKAGLRPDILLVVDSAYAEYVTADDYDVGQQMALSSDNVVMVRTFSKMGLADARIGWMTGPDHVLDAVNRLRGPFNVNRPAQMAGAAAVRDSAFIEKLRTHNAEWRDWLTSALSSNGMRVLPSQGNFILVLFEDAESAARAFNALMDAGLVVREMGAGYEIANGLRITIGTEPAMRAVANVLEAFK